MIELTDEQHRASNIITTFIQSTNDKMLLLGCAGSGKTTVITNAFNQSPLRVAFCAFTNKATQVLRNIASKFAINFTADFSTIHKLLALEPNFLDNERELSFVFDRTKLEHLRNYDVIIFDECSTISLELYNYIMQSYEYMVFAHKHILKFIFLGDYWQLPPVGEEISIVFTNSTTESWPIAKLTKVMRSKDEKIYKLNMQLLYYIDVFRKASLAQNKELIDRFIYDYPYNLITDRIHYLPSTVDLYEVYLDVMHRDSCVILTYSNSNCVKTNHAIQDRIDVMASRQIPDNRDTTKFYAGDRCCIDKPIEVYNIQYIYNAETNSTYAAISTSTGENLYNGEIFTIVAAEEMLIKTMLNYSKYGTDLYFPGQILTVTRIGCETMYKIIHIDQHYITTARKLIRARMYRSEYINLLSTFTKIYPLLTYGYCITLYKSQGSEYHTVLVNLPSIKYCLTKDKQTIKEKKALLRATYTAVSRATTNVYVFSY
jgi:hypothetical protein